MFNKNDFINWVNSAQKDNTTMQDFRSYHFNPMNQMNEYANIVAQGMKVAAKPVIKTVGKAVTSNAAKTLAVKSGEEAIKKGASVVGSAAAAKVLSKKNKPEEVEQQESVQLDEFVPQAIGAGIVGYGAYKGVKGIQSMQAKGIEKRAQRSSSAYGGGTDRPFNFADKRKEMEAKARAKLAQAAQDAQENTTLKSDWSYRKSAGIASASNGLSEMKTDRLQRYAKDASAELGGVFQTHLDAKGGLKRRNRRKGVNKAIDRLATRKTRMYQGGERGSEIK